MDRGVASRIAALGDVVSPETLDASRALYADAHEEPPYDGVVLTRDVAYGPHERHRARPLRRARIGRRAGDPLRARRRLRPRRQVDAGHAAQRERRPVGVPVGHGRGDDELPPGARASLARGRAGRRRRGGVAARERRRARRRPRAHRARRLFGGSDAHRGLRGHARAASGRRARRPRPGRCCRVPTTCRPSTTKPCSARTSAIAPGGRRRLRSPAWSRRAAGDGRGGRARPADLAPPGGDGLHGPLRAWRPGAAPRVRRRPQPLHRGVSPQHGRPAARRPDRRVRAGPCAGARARRTRRRASAPRRSSPGQSSPRRSSCSRMASSTSSSALSRR